MFVERYQVVPAVDVEALRAALRSVVAGGATAVALGPSLLGTLDMDALPVGMHPFVDPDRAVRPLRDDLVLLAGDGADPAHYLSGTAVRVGRVPLDEPTPAAAADGVLALVQWAEDGVVRCRWALSPHPTTAVRQLDHLLAAVPAGADGPAGADLYVVLPAGRLAQVLAPRDG